MNLFDQREGIQERFERFHAENPHVYELFKRFAREARDKGMAKYSADIICARIRWHINVETRSSEEFKINDHFTSRYARLLMQDDPTFAEFFETRTLKTA